MKHKVLDKGFVELITANGSDLGCVRTARISYQQDVADTVFLTGQDRALLDYLIKNDHTSPFEHNMMMFHVKCPIFVARQWMRHRIGWSYNEVSRRYTSSHVDFYTPGKQEIRYIDESNIPAPNARPDRVISAFSNLAGDVYTALINADVKYEQARMVLPLNAYTRFYATTNLRALMHFYKLRTSKGAQKEIAEYAMAMGKFANGIFPYTWHSFQKNKCENAKID